MRFRLFLYSLTFILLLAYPGFSRDDSDAVTPTGLGVGVGVWIKPNFSGVVKDGTEISLNSQLGLTSQNLVVPHVWYRWAHGQIFDARYTQYSQTVTTTLNAPQTFAGVSFPQGSQATTSTTLQWADLSYELPIAYDRFPPVDSYLNAVMNLKAIRGVFSMTNPLGQGGNHKPITVPFPMFGLHGRYRVFSDTDLEFKATGIRAGFEDAIGWSYDFEAAVNQRFVDYLTLTGKYRYTTFYNRDSNDNRFQFRFYGPEVDASIHF